jgi:hypothetical protein
MYYITYVRVNPRQYVAFVTWNCVMTDRARIHVTGRGGPYGCETSRLPHFLDNRLTGGGKVISLKRQQPFTPNKIPGTHFCWRLCRPQGYSAAGRIRSIQTSNDQIGNRTRDLPACRTKPLYMARRICSFLLHKSVNNAWPVTSVYIKLHKFRALTTLHLLWTVHKFLIRSITMKLRMGGG